MNLNEERIIKSGISSIWFSVLDQLKEGRLSLCKACDRPFVSKRERGQKREFCSNACKQWAHNHPNEKREQK